MSVFFSVHTSRHVFIIVPLNCTLRNPHSLRSVVACLCFDRCRRCVASFAQERGFPLSSFPVLFQLESSQLCSEIEKKMLSEGALPRGFIRDKRECAPFFFIYLCDITLVGRGRGSEEGVFPTKRDLTKQQVQNKLHSTLSFLFYSQSLSISLFFSFFVNCGDKPRALPPSHLAALEREDERRRRRRRSLAAAAAAARCCRRRLDLDSHGLSPAPVPAVEHPRDARSGPQKLRERCFVERGVGFSMSSGCRREQRKEREKERRKGEKNFIFFFSAKPKLTRPELADEVVLVVQARALAAEVARHLHGARIAAEEVGWCFFLFLPAERKRF